MKKKRDRGSPLIAVVGPCASGKTTLVDALKAQGYDARQIAQEHSYVPSMWKKITKPDVLIYLDASYETCTARKDLDWNQKEYQTQIERLSHARQHTHLYIDTEGKKQSEIAETALQYLREFIDRG